MNWYYWALSSRIWIFLNPQFFYTNRLSIHTKPVSLLIETVHLFEIALYSDLTTCLQIQVQKIAVSKSRPEAGKVLHQLFGIQISWFCSITS